MASEKKVLDNIVNVENLRLKLDKKSWGSLEDLLHSSAIQLQAEDKRKELSPQVLDSFVEVLEICVTLINENKDAGQKILIECFRNLRNSCVSLTINQDYLVNHTSSLDDTCKVIDILLDPSQEFNPTCLKVAIQFLGNLIVDNNNAKLKVWEKCSKLLIILLKNEDVQVANFSTMVLYNILLSHTRLGAEIDKESLKSLLNLSMKESEYAVYTIELLVRREQYLESLYKDLESEHKLLTLDMLHHVVGQKSGKDSDTPLPDLHLSVLKFVAQLFKERSFLILKTVDKYVENLEPREVARLLDIMSSASGRPEYLEELQKDKSLLIDCTFLLKSMHEIGLESENHFSVIPKLSELNLKGKDYEMQQHPAFGFKSSLVQLLGNLCWKHKVNQDQVLELEGIQLLLDCCKIDARNPLLMQWAILAVRNLCDNNQDCQAIVAGLTKRGEIDASTLNQLGLTLNEGPEGSIGIVPLQR